MMSTSSAVADLGKRLLEASRKGNAEEVRQLMATGAPITTDWLGTSPLHLAAQYGHTVTAEVLLRAGVSRDGKTKVDKTPLHLAAQQGNFEIAQMLIKYGATINVIDMLSMTPLHWAVEAHSQPICKLLMEHGARTDITNKFGKTPVDIVKSKGFKDILEILLSVAYAPQENGTKRLLKSDDSFFMEHKKRARTRKFPMTAGSWTVGEMQTVDKEERFKAKEAKRSPKNEENLKASSTERMDTTTTASNLSSLVDAAAMVRSKVQDISAGSNQVATTASGDLPHKHFPMLTEPSVLDTLATLATASTQMTTSGCETNQQGQKVASHTTPAVAPSFVTIPGIQGPVQIVQANPNHSGILHHGQIASALPPGMIQLASPLAFNILPGGRFQIGQQIMPGHPFQMPLQQTGAQMVAASSGQNFAVVGGLPPGQVIPKPINVTDATQSRGGVVMSPVSQGMTSNNIPASAQPLPSTTTTKPNALKPPVTAGPFGVQHGLLPQQPGVIPSPLASAQLAPAFQYANIGSGLAPIPLVPVAGIGGIQLVPQAMLQTQLLNAVRGGVSQSPNVGTVQPQFVTPGGAYTIPMSPLNLSSILPTALSLSQIPISHQTVNTLAQHSMGTSLSPRSASKVLTQPNPGAQTSGDSQQQANPTNTQDLIITAAHSPMVTSNAQHQSLVLGAQSDSINPSTSQQRRGIIVQGAQTDSAFSSAAQMSLGPIASQSHLASVLAQQGFGAHQSISVADLHQTIANSIGYQPMSAQHQVGIPSVAHDVPISGANLSASAQPVADLDGQIIKTTTKQPQGVSSETNKENSLMTQLSIATVESKSPSLIVSSNHSPRMPISLGAFAAGEEEMQGISPSRISPTKSRSSTPSIFSTTASDQGILGNHSPKTDGIQASSPYTDNPSLVSNVTAGNSVPGSTVPGNTVPGNHVLPHLQHLIYKQLLQSQQPRQEQCTTASESLSPHQSEDAKDEVVGNQSPMPDQVHSPSPDFEDRSHDQTAVQSEFFWRVIEQENPDLKRQFAESELESELYSEEFEKTEAKEEGIKNLCDEEKDKMDVLLIKSSNEELTSLPESNCHNNNEHEKILEETEV